MSDINNITNDENEQQTAQNGQEQQFGGRPSMGGFGGPQGGGQMNGRPPMPPHGGHGQQFGGQPPFGDQQTDNASDTTEV